MAIQLNNDYEKTTWNVWSQALKHLSHYSLRKQYYPNRMDELDNMGKQLTACRREAVNRVKQYSLLDFKETTIEEQQQFRLYKSDVENFVRKEGRQAIADDLAHFIETMIQKETQCLESIMVVQQERIRKTLEEEAVEGLLLLRKVTQQKKTEKTKKEKKQKNEVPLRRSTRILSKQ